MVGRAPAHIPHEVRIAAGGRAWIRTRPTRSQPSNQPEPEPTISPRSLSGETTQKVLVCIFSDRKVLQALELAHSIQFVRGGKAPDGLLTIFKRHLGKHMKVGFPACSACAYRLRHTRARPYPQDKYYLYQNEIKSEIAHIERTQALKARAVGIAGSEIVALFVGLANVGSKYYYDLYMGDDDDAAQ